MGTNYKITENNCQQLQKSTIKPDILCIYIRMYVNCSWNLAPIAILQCNQQTVSEFRKIGRNNCTSWETWYNPIEQMFRKSKRSVHEPTTTNCYYWLQ